MVPQLLLQGLLHLGDQLQRWGQLGRSDGGVTQLDPRGRPLGQLRVWGFLPPVALYAPEPLERRAEPSAGPLRAEWGWEAWAWPGPNQAFAFYPRPGPPDHSQSRKGCDAAQAAGPFACVVAGVGVGGQDLGDLHLDTE